MNSNLSSSFTALVLILLALLQGNHYQERIISAVLLLVTILSLIASVLLYNNYDNMVEYQSSKIVELELNPEEVEENNKKRKEFLIADVALSSISIFIVILTIIRAFFIVQ